MLVAFDTMHENHTQVRIRIKDVNDLPPVFDQTTYVATILEEDDVGLPKRIMKVHQARFFLSNLHPFYEC